jgi:hypothetical protein
LQEGLLRASVETPVSVKASDGKTRAKGGLGATVTRHFEQPVPIAPGVISNTMGANWLPWRFAMPLNTEKIDDAALALLYLTLHDDCRAWKGFDWGVLGRLHDKGMIHDPVGKVKSVVFTQEGLERAKALFEEMFKK